MSTVSYVTPLEMSTGFHYYSTDDTPPTRSSGVVHYFYEKISTFLRDSFYLPLNRSLNSASKRDLKLADDVDESLFSGWCPSSDIKTILNHFTVRRVSVFIHADVTRVFNVRLFESKYPIAGKILKFVTFSFYGNKEYTETENTMRDWNPQTIQELSQAPMDVIKALKAFDIGVDTLMTHSLGNVALDSLSENSSLPRTLVISRGLTSTNKVIEQLYPWGVSHILQYVTHTFGWKSDPEEKLLQFLENEAQKESCMEKRRVMIFEVKEDYYYSGKSGFEPDYDQKLRSTGAAVLHVKLHPFPFHPRAHHALGENHLVFNISTKAMENTEYIPLPDGQNVAEFLAQRVILSSPLPEHTCFIIGPNDAPQSLLTARTVCPLLLSVIQASKAAELDLRPD